MKLFDLNIDTILEAWDVSDAVREIIANAIDEQLLTGTPGVEIYESETCTWHIRDYGRGLKYEHLTQNENDEKLSSKKPIIGKFGVGLKDALATLHRHNIDVLIHSQHATFTIKKTSKHGFSNVETLHAEVGPAQAPEFKGTEFILSGVSAIQIQKSKDHFLRFSNEIVLEETSYGQILRCDSGSARIYVNGVRVASEDNMLFSYNITSLTAPMRKALNRERTNVGRTAYSDRLKSMLLDCKSQEVIDYLVSDLEKFKSGEVHDELQWLDVKVHACKLLNASQKVIFLTSDQLLGFPDTTDRAQRDGYRVVVIPDDVSSKIKNKRDVQGKPIRDISQYEKQWNESFEFHFVKSEDLTPEEKKVFSLIEGILKAIGGKPRTVRKICISETMRLESGVQAVGLWEAEEGRIVIKRDQLKTCRDFAGTFLHEIAHARSGAGDMSRRFENELTSLLGLVVENYSSADARSSTTP